MKTITQHLHTLAVFTVTITLLIAGTLLAPTAEAATFAYSTNFGGWRIGAYRTSSGYLAYCLDSAGAYPGSPQSSPERVNTLPAYSSNISDSTGWRGTVTSGQVSGERVRQINWLLTEHGQNVDNATAPAIQLAVWILHDDPGEKTWVNHHLNWVQNHGGAWQVQKAREYVAQAQTSAVPPPEIPEPAPLSLTSTEKFGSGTLAYPAGTTKIKLVGATFTDTGETSRHIADGKSGTAPWTTVLHENGWQRHHTVQAEGEWNYSYNYYPDQLLLHRPTRTGEQNLGSLIGPVQEQLERPLPRTELTIDSQFQPQLTTQVPQRFINRGEQAQDTVTFTAAQTSAPWPQRPHNGQPRHLPVTAQGTLYGPFAHPQQENNTPTAGLPIEAHATVLADKGPGKYAITSSTPLKEAGYYYWVWKITTTEQPRETRDSHLIAANYEYTDKFGQNREGHVVPTEIDWQTRLNKTSITVDELHLKDHIQLNLREGAWLRGPAGTPLPIRMRLNVYQSDTKPVQADKPPAKTKLVATTLVTLDGRTRQKQSEQIQLPLETRGWVSVQSCIAETDQLPESRHHFVEKCDDYGQASETANIREPKVRSTAQKQGKKGETIQDTAIVTGHLPENTKLSFRYYLQPTANTPKYDKNWQPKIDEQGKPLTWKTEELEQMGKTEKCLAQPVAQTKTVPARLGEVTSPKVQAKTVGNGYWVEELHMPHPRGNGSYTLHTGKCGLQSENTNITVKTPPPLPSTGTPELGIPGFPGKLTEPAKWLAVAGIAAITGGAATLLGRRKQQKPGSHS